MFNMRNSNIHEKICPNFIGNLQIQSEPSAATQIQEKNEYIVAGYGFAK